MGYLDRHLRALRARLARSKRAGRANDGYTLIEVLIVAALGVGVLAATITPIVSTQRSEVQAAGWQDQLQLGGSQEARMMHEIRQAYAVIGTGPNYIDFLIWASGTQEQVYYECDVAQTGTSYHKCVRLQTTVGGTLPAISTGTPIVTNVVNGTPADPVFGYSPDGFNPTYVTVHLAFPSSNGSALGLSHSIVVNDGAYLRNPALTT